MCHSPQEFHITSIYHFDPRITNEMQLKVIKVCSIMFAPHTVCIVYVYHTADYTEGVEI